MLCIMDGFGWTPDETYGNAVAAANKPNLDKIFANYPMTTIQASGLAVGLPDGQMGNSEVGHTNMGAGRIVYQQLTLITKSIKDGEMLKNPVLVKNMKAAIDAGKAIHLMGLVGTGGVHSHADHWYGVLEMAKHMGAKDVYLHCIMDGRDTDPHSGKGFLADLQAKLDKLGLGKIASVSGRYYACLLYTSDIAETEKYAHVTFFFNGGVEQPCEGEDRKVIPSPKVATYDLKPEMSAYEVADECKARIESGKYDVIILNFANCDMVGHTGVFDAAVKAVEAVDKCVGEVTDAVLNAGGVVFLTADHGNAEKMKNPDGSPFTAHTTNVVPFAVIGAGDVKLREGGCLADIAPTLLPYIGLPVPEDRQEHYCGVTSLFEKRLGEKL